MLSTLACGTLAGVLWSMSSKEGENLLAFQRLASVWLLSRCKDHVQGSNKITCSCSARSS